MAQGWSPPRSAIQPLLPPAHLAHIYGTESLPAFVRVYEPMARWIRWPISSGERTMLDAKEWKLVYRDRSSGGAGLYPGGAGVWEKTASP